MVSQSGFENVVATSGTALTPFQIKILKRYSDNLLTAFDMDLAGDTATKRGIDLAQNQGFNVKIVTLEPGLDPADTILKNPKEWTEKIETAKSILDFYFGTAFSKFDKDKPEGKMEISKILLPVIKRIPNKIVQAHWSGELAKKLRVKEEDIEEELKKIKLGDYSEVYGIEPEEIKNLPPKSRRELLEERLVTLILKSPQNLNLIEKKYLTSFLPNIREVLIKLKKNQEPDSDFFNYLALKAEIEEIEEREIVPEIQYCLKELSSLEIKNKLDQISKDIKEAEEEKDLKKVGDLTQKFKDTTSELTSL